MALCAHKQSVHKILDENTDSLLTKFGLKYIASVLYNIAMTFVSLIYRIIAVVK